MKKRKIVLMVCMAAVMFTLLAVSCFAEGEVTSAVDVSSVFSTGITTVQSTIMGFIAAALPIALAIGGTVLAVKFGWGFFKRLTGRS